MGCQKKVIGALVFLSIFSSSYAQKQIRGIVIDSATFAPLANVNIRIKNSFLGTVTNAKGEFKISVTRKDTLVFSLVGYFKEEFAADELDETSIIRMTEEVTVLQTVNVSPKDKAKGLRPTHLAPAGNLLNFGNGRPGFNLGYFSKPEREKRKLLAVQAENRRVKNYVAVVCSPEVRERITQEYAISDDEYYGILAQFNLENGDSLYNLTSEELIVVLDDYYKNNVRRR